MNARDYYAYVVEEIEQGKLDRVLWAQAFVDAKGEESATKARYIALRVEEIQAAHRRQDRAQLINMARGKAHAFGEAAEDFVRKILIMILWGMLGILAFGVIGTVVNVAKDSSRTGFPPEYSRHSTPAPAPAPATQSPHRSASEEREYQYLCMTLERGVAPSVALNQWRDKLLEVRKTLKTPEEVEKYTKEVRKFDEYNRRRSVIP